jgi:hypothetical protein
VLSIAKKGKKHTFDYVFDAKYRIDFAVEGSYYKNRYKNPGPLEEDINTMHRYRDAIVARQKGPYERTAFGAYVLFPWGLEHMYTEHHFYKSIEEVNIGGLPFLPSATDLVEQFVERLIEKSPEELQAEGILPRGTQEEWLSALDEKVLISVVSTEEQYQLCMQQAVFELPGNQLKGCWQEAVYVALYVSKEVGRQNGVVCYGRITEVEVAAGGSVMFHVGSWVNVKHVIKPVNYGIAGYAMTTLNALKEATELPELFMKSRDEKLVWRVLRRVSDQIKIELDSELLDEARGVETFQVNGLEIVMSPGERVVEIVGESESVKVSYGELERNPSAVFRVVCGMMG